MFEQLDEIGRENSNNILQMTNAATGAKPIDIGPVVRRATYNALTDVENARGLANRGALVEQINNLHDEMLGTFDRNGKMIGRVNHTNLTPSEVVEVRRSMGKNIAWDAMQKDPEVRQFVNRVRKEV